MKINEVHLAGVFSLVLSVESVCAVHQPTTESVQDKREKEGEQIIGRLVG
jgi:hypothetical protein